MARTKGETTKLVNAKTRSDSLRATVPSFIVKTLHLEAGDELEWEIESIEFGTVKVRIVKSKNIANKE
jgi:antitoxin component of MazEF toxin-antitoxin module